MKLIIDVPENIMDTIEDDQMISREQLAVLQKHILDGIPYNVCEEWKVSYEELEFLENLKGGCAGCRIITKLDQKRRPQGYWDKVNHGDYENPDIAIRCSECLEEVDEESNFCPYCGASMRGIE